MRTTNNSLGASYLRETYARAARQYHADDEEEVKTQNHRHFRAILERLTDGHNLKVLDACCGTLRYAHCLRNVEELTGLDLSPEMLELAKTPVLQHQVTAKSIRLIPGSIFNMPFKPESFDLIYALGGFGLGCPLTVAVINSFHTCLKPGGKLFFNVVKRTKNHRKFIRVLHRLAVWCFPWLFDKRVTQIAMCELTERELRDIVDASRFRNAVISTHVCQSPLWQGAHLECFVVK